MNPYQRKIFGLVPLWSAIMLLGCLIILATAAVSVYYKDRLKERVKTANAPKETPRFVSEAERIEDRLRFLQNSIKSEKRLAEVENGLPVSAEEKKRRQQARAVKIEKWENEIGELNAKKEELTKKTPEAVRGGWDEEGDADLLFAVAITGGAGLFLAYLAVFQRIKTKPDEFVTDLDKRAVLFLAAAFFGSMSGFLLFLWYLSFNP